MVSFGAKVLVLSICVISIYLVTELGYAQQNESAAWQEQMNNGATLIVQGKRRFLLDDSEQRLRDIVQQDELQNMEAMKQILGATNNICLNQKDPKKFTKTQYVEEFIAGPCAPVVILPGVAGTSLSVLVDCETLRDKNPKVFDSCGWETCSSWYFWLDKPESEYRLWISTSTNPMGIIMYRQNDHCFGDIIQEIYDPQQPDPKQRYSDPVGLKITYYGNTPETNKHKDCGVGAIQTITDDLIIKAMGCEYKGYQNIPTLLNGMGYLSGLLYQAIPYDFRRGLASTTSTTMIQTAVENLYKITGKKAIILGHSLGGLHALHSMHIQTQEWKDQYVGGILTFGTPFLGSTKVLRSNLGGDPGYLSTFLGLNVGINYYCQNKAINTMSSMQDLYPKDTFFRFRNEPWMKELMARIEYEKQFIQSDHHTDKINPQLITDDQIPLPWFPGPIENCAHGFPTRSNNCLTHLSDLTEPFMNINGINFTAQKEDLMNLVGQYSMDPLLLQQYFQESWIDDMDNLKHPGVPMIIVFGSYQNIEEQFHYAQNPKDAITKSQNFYFPDITQYRLGDGTVMTSSAITPAIKWIYENQQNQTQFGTKLVEFCSTYSKISTSQVYDGLNDDGSKFIKESGYMGIPCSCVDKWSDISSCEHPCMINDKYIVELTSEVVQNKQKSVYTSGKTPIDDATLNKFISDCTNLQGFHNSN